MCYHAHRPARSGSADDRLIYHYARLRNVIITCPRGHPAQLDYSSVTRPSLPREGLVTQNDYSNPRCACAPMVNKHCSATPMVVSLVSVNNHTNKSVYFTTESPYLLYVCVCSTAKRFQRGMVSYLPTEQWREPTHSHPNY